MAQWSTKYIDSLPDSSFAIIESGYEDGVSSKDARHLPFKDIDGNVDIPHLKAAWDRRDQIKSVLGNDTDEDLRDAAENVLEPYYKKYVTKGKEPDEKEDTSTEEQDNRQVSKEHKMLDDMQISFSRHDPELGVDVYSMENVVHCAVRAVASEPPINNIDAKHANADPSADASVPSNIVRQRWRLLSAVKAWPHSGFYEPQLVDYTENGGEALKSGVSLINRHKPDLIWDHSDSSKDIAGNVQNAEWEGPSDIVAGLNADVCVNENYDPKAAIGLRDGIIRSGSIGIKAEFIRSHPDMKLEQFVTRQGKTIDGKEVRWIAKRITSVGHMAILPAGEGADPNAGPRTSPVNNQKTVVTQKVDPAGSTITTKTGGRKMTDTLKYFGEVANLLKVDFSLDETTVEPGQLREVTDNLSKRITGLLDSSKILCSYQAKIKEFEPFVIFESEQQLNDSEILARIPAKLEYGESFLASQRKEATDWFDKAKVDPAAEMSANDKAIRSRIAHSHDMKFVQEQLTLYKEIADGRFGPLRSAESAPVENEPEKPQPIAHNEVLEDFKAMFEGGRK